MTLPQPQRPSIPSFSDLGWGALHSLGFFLGMLIVISYAIGGMSGPLMGEMWGLLGLLSLLTLGQSRIFLTAILCGGTCVWIAVDPMRDAVATGTGAGILIGAGGLLGTAYWLRRKSFRIKL